MVGEGVAPLEKLQAAVREFRGREGERVDLRGLRGAIDALEGEFAAEARRAQKAADHLADGSATVVSWISRTCHMSATSAADRLCVGAELEALPRVATALGAGEIGYQSASLLCHLREQLAAERDLFDEEEMLEHARRHSVSSLRFLCRYARHIADPDGFFNEGEQDYSRRRLRISLMADGMHSIDGVLDSEGGAALRTALGSLARRLGPEDDRSHQQRLADSLTEVVRRAMDAGHLPLRNGIRPHLSVTTTVEGLQGLPGAPAADLELAMPISTRAVERIACDATISRVLLADSVVVDVGRATRVVSAATRRGLRARDRGCRWPGCDRQVDWSTPHHIVAWSRGGETKLSNLVLLCHFHHRLVHEGGWRVVKAGREFRFLPPDRVVMRRARGPGIRWAA